MDIISENELVALFDQLVSEGVIVYGPHTKHVVEDEGYPVSCPCTPAPLYADNQKLMMLRRSSSVSARPSLPNHTPSLHQTHLTLIQPVPDLAAICLSLING